MGQKFLRVLLIIGLVLIALIFMIFILSNMGFVSGILASVLLLIMGGIFIRYLISSGKIFTPPASKDDAPKHKITERKMPLGAGLGGFTKSGAVVVDKE